MLEALKLAKWGGREIGIALVATVVFCAIFIWGGLWFLCLLPGALFAFVLFFFRDPERITPENTKALFSPADGVITHVEIRDEPDFVGGKAMMVGMFLSIFDVHLNRAPCAGKVAKIFYKEGAFHDARTPECASENEANSIGMETSLPGNPRILVKQIAGVIARRIVCDVKIGDSLAAGQKLGMIKFGSRTELYLPADAGFKPLVKVGDVMRAGTTILGEIQ